MSVKWGRQGRVRGELSQHGRAQQAHSLPDHCPQPQRQEQHGCHRHPLRPVIGGAFPDRHQFLRDPVRTCLCRQTRWRPRISPCQKGGTLPARGVDALASPVSNGAPPDRGAGRREGPAPSEGTSRRRSARGLVPRTTPEAHLRSYAPSVSKLSAGNDHRDAAPVPASRVITPVRLERARASPTNTRRPRQRSERSGAGSLPHRALASPQDGPQITTYSRNRR